MSVWYCIPSKRPAHEVQARLAKWERQGYLTAIWRDTGDAPVECTMLLQGEYEGYARTVNRLAKEVLAEDPDAAWLVAGGDDTDPDPNHTAEEIGRDCSDYFAALHIERLDANPDHSRIAVGSLETWNRWCTFGVMQPTGDRWGECHCGRCVMCKQFGGCAYIDRVAGSPWMGREWCERANGGRGPLWSDFYHMYVDQFLQETAIKYGVFWQRPDLTHMHHHWMKPANGKPPAFLREVNGAAHWKQSGDLFQKLKLQGFPGSEPLPVSVPTLA